MTSTRANRNGSAAALLLAAACTLSAPAALAATLYGLIDTGELHSSANNGVTWAPLSTLPVSDATGLAARLSSSDLFLASRSGSVYRSLDAGVNWTAVGAISASDLEDLVIRPDGTILALTATGSLYGSADLGASFTTLAAITGSNFVSLCFTTPVANYYALTRTGEVYESVDDGASWVAKGTMAVSDAQRIRALQSNLYVLTETGDIFKSTDAAASWTAVGTLSQVGMRGLVRNGSNLAAATKEGHVATSADGAAWAWQGSMNQLALTALASNEIATTGVEMEPPGAGLLLGPVFPSPTTGPASFVVRSAGDDEVRLTLHDTSGRLVARRPPETLAAGTHTLSWNPSVARTGIYFLRLESTAGLSASRRWLVVR